jgi:hypothetical protein
VLRVLGQGGMGVVYEVRDPQLDRILAMKLIRDVRASDTAVERFWREAEVLGRIQHPNVVRVHQIGQAHEGTYLLMERVEGEPLSDVVERGPLEVNEAARIVRTLADALRAVHAAGILHRDLKPHNVILRPDGSPTLLDFGLVRDESLERLTKTGVSLGTPAYMSPEQAKGVRTSELGPQTDVYGLGVILYELATGEAPFTGSAIDVMRAVIFQDPTRPSDVHDPVPAELEAICAVAMAKEPEDRYPTAEALRADLDRFLAGEAPAALEMGVYRTPRLRRILRLAVGLAVILAVIVVGLSLAPRGPSEKDQRAEAQAIVDRGQELLASSDAFSRDSEAFAELARRLEALETDAKTTEARVELGTAQAIVWSTAGLASLARDDRESATRAAERLIPLGKPKRVAAPAVNALHGLLAVAEGRREGVRLIGRALNGGVAWPELRLARARFLLSSDTVSRGDAEAALGDLRTVQKTAPLSRASKVLEAQAHLALGQTRKAEDLARALAPLEPELGWPLALARVEALAAQDPGAALAVLKLWAPPSAQPPPLAERRAAAAKRVLASVHDLLLRLEREQELPRPDENRLFAGCRLARALVPERLLPEQVRLQLIEGTVGARANGAFAIALAALEPTDYAIQRACGLVALREAGYTTDRLTLLEALERAVELAPPEDALELDMTLCAQLAEDGATRERCIERSTALLARLAPGDDGRAGVLLLARARSRRGLEDLEGAHDDLQEARRRAPNTAELKIRWAELLLALNRPDSDVAEAYVAALREEPKRRVALVAWRYCRRAGREDLALFVSSRMASPQRPVWTVLQAMIALELRQDDWTTILEHASAQLAASETPAQREGARALTALDLSDRDACHASIFALVKELDPTLAISAD